MLNKLFHPQYSFAFLFWIQKRIFFENSPFLFKKGRVLAHRTPIPLVPSFAPLYYLLHSIILSIIAFIPLADEFPENGRNFILIPFFFSSFFWSHPARPLPHH